MSTVGDFSNRNRIPLQAHQSLWTQICLYCSSELLTVVSILRIRDWQMDRHLFMITVQIYSMYSDWIHGIICSLLQTSLFFVSFYLHFIDVYLSILKYDHLPFWYFFFIRLHHSLSNIYNNLLCNAYICTFHVFFNDWNIAAHTRDITQFSYWFFLIMKTVSLLLL